MANMAAVILAGGRGKRMDVLCEARPKPLLPFAGRFKVIDFSLSNCVHSQINDIFVLTDYQRSSMANYIYRWCLMNTDKMKLRVLEPQNDSYSGTANAVYQNLDYFNSNAVDAVLVLAGDHIYNLDYRKMLAFHRNVNADITVGVIPVPIEQVHRFGTVTLDADGRIIDFIEKSPVPQSNLASMGIYIFNKKILAERLIEDAGDESSRHDFGYSILPKMVNRDRAFAYKFNGYWKDIGTVEAYYEANMEQNKKKPGFDLNSISPIMTAEKYLVSPLIGKQAHVRNSLISHGSIIKGLVINSILSPRVIVDEGAVVKDSLIMEDTFIGRHSVVDGCVLDEGIKVGDYCQIGFGKGLTSDDIEITVLGKGVTVPPYTVIGHGYKVLSNAGTPGYVINAGTTVEVRQRRSMSGFQLKEVAVSES